MEAKTILQRISIETGGTVFVGHALQIVNGDTLMSLQHHNFPITPDDDVQKIIDIVSKSIVSLGFPAIAQAAVGKIMAVVELARGAADAK